MNLFYPIELFATWLIDGVFHLDKGTLLAEAAQFFIVDVIKILILLLLITFLVSLARSFLPPHKIHQILEKKKGWFGRILAALFGIITPFCSCSAVPLFLGFVEAGVPLGITFTFLIASPMINEVALVLLFGLFGMKVALIYVVSGLLIAIFSGFLIEKIKVENLIESYVYDKKQERVKHGLSMSWRERIAYARHYTGMIVQKVWFFVVIGIGIGAWIHGYVPIDFLARYAGADKWYAIPLATLIGIPLYSNAAGVIPLVNALTEKGVSMGTALAFMMAVTALSFPEFVILKKVMKAKLIAIFAGIVGVGIMIVGYLFNWLLG